MDYGAKGKRSERWSAEKVRALRAHLGFTQQQLSAELCLTMFRPQTLFDSLLRPAIENPNVDAIRFVLDSEQRDLWNTEVNQCAGRNKVADPSWTLIQENVSLILNDVTSSAETECLLSFWGEPFMARTIGQNNPRYVFHVLSTSGLIGRFVDLVRGYRFQH